MRRLKFAFPLMGLLCLLTLAGTREARAAQPFAMPGAPAATQSTDAAPATADAASQSAGWNPAGDLLAYAMEMQQSYYRSMGRAFRAVNLEGSLAAAWALASLSFAYGIFHAVGPGHGKVVVTSYLLADEREVKRGIFIAFLASFAQAVTAIIVVGALAVILGLTHRAVAEAVPTVERLSYVLVIGVGAALLWRAFRRGKHAHAHEAHDHHHGRDHAHHGHDDHHHDDHAGHAHMPTPQDLRAHNDWRSVTAMILSVGLRPCTGAILVLLFALTQGAFLIGALSAFAMSIGTAITVSTLAVMTVASKNLALRIASTTDNPWTRRIERGLEIGGGLFILLMGISLMLGSFFIAQSPLI